MWGILEIFMIMSAQASILILAALIFRQLFKRFSKWFIYLIWIAVVIRLLVPVTIENPFQGNTVGEYTRSNVQNWSYQASHNWNNNWSSVTTDTKHQTSTAGVVTPAVTTEKSSASLSLEQIFLIGWVAGAVVMTLYYIWHYIRIRYTLRFAVRLKGNIWECDMKNAPFIFGFIRPRIYLPFHQDEKSRQYMKKHEETHLKHFDPQMRGLILVATILHWWNPVVWAGMYFMKKDMEMLCDESAVKHTSVNDRKDYMNVLLKHSITNGSKSFILAFGESNTENRVKNLARKKTSRVISIIMLFLVFVLLVAGCTVKTTSSISSGNDKAQSATTETSSQDSSTTTQTTAAAESNTLSWDEQGKILFQVPEGETRYYENIPKEYQKLIPTAKDNWYDKNGTLMFPYMVDGSLQPAYDDEVMTWGDPKENFSLTKQEFIIAVSSQIPEDLASKLTTDELFGLVFQYYNIESHILAERFTTNVNSLFNQFNGFDLLLKRSDYVKSLYKFLMSDTVDGYVKDDNYGSFMRLLLLENLVIQNNVYDALTTEEREKVVDRFQDISKGAPDLFKGFTNGSILYPVSEDSMKWFPNGF